MKYLVALILVGIVIILMIVIVYNLGKTTERASFKQTCKSSVQARAKLVQLPMGTTIDKDKASIECPTQYVTIADKSDTKKKETVAKLIADCWDNYGQGKVILFNPRNMRFCAICDVVQFKDQSKPLVGLSGFMMTNKVPIGIDPNHRTYYEFLTGQKPTQAQIGASAQVSAVDSLDTKKRYMIVYTYFKETDIHKFVRENPVAAGIVAGTYSGMQAGAVAQMAIPIPGVGFLVGFLVGSSVGSDVTSAVEKMQKPADSSQTVASSGNAGLDFDANIMVFEYSAQGLSQLGCDELPVSNLDKRFR
jgi:hypothetical protein